VTPFDKIDEAMAERVDPQDVKQYLTFHGWKLIRVRDSGLEIWARDDTTAGMLVAPARWYEYYLSHMVQVAGTLGEYEGREPWEVLADFAEIRRKRVYKGRLAEMVFAEDPDAATMEKRTVWMSLDGHMCVNEAAARRVSATHRLCSKCNTVVVDKNHMMCPGCYEKRDIERYAKKPRVKWDGKGMLYSEVLEEYFSDMDEVEEALFERNEDSDDLVLTLDDLRLVIAQPSYARTIDTSYWFDDLPDEGDIPEWLSVAVETFNATLEGQEPLSYGPTGPALDLSEYGKKENADEEDAKEDEEDVGV
jgi:hypothetical protein